VCVPRLRHEDGGYCLDRRVKIDEDHEPGWKRRDEVEELTVLWDIAKEESSRER
jgi:hypothetical protein